ncbi:hypothetical protein K469DRAFT_780440, partial [Zopfia rhizophila CBS 207.26]
YEFYQDVRHVQYTFEIRKIHERYGPIVRINPREIHISDPDSTTTSTLGRPRNWISGHGLPMLSGSWTQSSAVKHDVPRVHRAALNPFFSKAKVRSLQPQIEEMLAKLLRFAEFRKLANQ